MVRRWGIALALAVLLGGLLGCGGRPADPEQIRRPVPSNVIPHKK